MGPPRLRKEDFKEIAAEHPPLVEQIKPILAGVNPAIQSSVLADLLSYWLAGIRPDLREQFFQRHIELVRMLLPVTERELYGGQGHPGMRTRRRLRHATPYDPEEEGK